MTDVVSKQIHQLETVTDLEPTDVLLLQRGTAPAVNVSVGSLLGYLADNGLGAGQPLSLPCVATGDAPVLKLTLKPGFAAVNGTADQVFCGYAPFANTGAIYVWVEGFIDIGDARELRGADGLAELTPGALQPGAYFEIKFLPTGRFSLSTPPALKDLPVVPLRQTNESANLLVVDVMPGFAWPADPLRAIYSLPIGASNPPFQGVVVAGMPFLGGDGRQMVRRDGVQILGGVLQPGVTAQFTFRADGKFILHSPSSGPPSYTVDVVLTDTTGNDSWVMHPVQTLANNTGLGIDFRVTNVPPRGENGLVGRVFGINDVDPLEIRGPSGQADDPVPMSAIEGGETVIFTRHPNGNWIIKRIDRPSLIPVGGAAPAPPPPPTSYLPYLIRASATARALQTHGY